MKVQQITKLICIAVALVLFGYCADDTEVTSNRTLSKPAQDRLQQLLAAGNQIIVISAPKSLGLQEIVDLTIVGTVNGKSITDANCPKETYDDVTILNCGVAGPGEAAPLTISGWSAANYHFVRPGNMALTIDENWVPTEESAQNIAGKLIQETKFIDVTRGATTKSVPYDYFTAGITVTGENTTSTDTQFVAGENNTDWDVVCISETETDTITDTATQSQTLTNTSTITQNTTSILTNTQTLTNIVTSTKVGTGSATIITTTGTDFTVTSTITGSDTFTTLTETQTDISTVTSTVNETHIEIVTDNATETVTNNTINTVTETITEEVEF